MAKDGLNRFFPAHLKVQVRASPRRAVCQPCHPSKRASRLYEWSALMFLPLGNVFGTRFTTFALIPTIGSRSITYLFAAILGLCTASLFLTLKCVRHYTSAKTQIKARHAAYSRSISASLRLDATPALHAASSEPLLRQRLPLAAPAFCQPSEPALVLLLCVR